jgi:hypothetical protein
VVLPGIEPEEHVAMEKGSGDVLIKLKDGQEAEAVATTVPFPS